MQTPRQKAIAAARARGQAKIAAGRKKYNSLTPLQRASMAQRQRARAKATTGNLTSAQSARKAQMLAQAKALGTKQMQATNKATPTRRKPTGRTLYKSRTTIPTRRKPTGRTVYKSRTTIPTRRKPTGRTLYKSRTTIPTRRRRK